MAEQSEVPIESFYVGRISHSDQLKSFDRVPTTRGALWSIWIAAALVFGVALVAPFVLLQELFAHNKVVGALVMLLLAVPAAWLSKRACKALEPWALRVQKTGDEQELGAPALSEKYVGVAYAEGVWSYRDDTMWDRGYLNLISGEISFRGLASTFGLALSQIQSVRVIQGKRLLFLGSPLVYVCWRDENGMENYFSLEIRDAKNVKETLNSTIALRDSLLEAIRADGGLSKAKFYEMPLKSSSLEFGSPKIAQKDILIALGWAAFCFAIVSAIGEVLRQVWNPDFAFTAVAGVLCVHVFNDVVYGRAVKRRKATTS